MNTIVPRWPTPPRVGAFFTTRAGGVSTAPYATLNLGDHVGDAPGAVAQNRSRVAAMLPGEPVWLTQVHGTRVVDAAAPVSREADASYTRTPGVVCVVMVADCLPVLLCDRGGSVVAAAHAGWRGLVDGVLEATVRTMGVPAGDLMAWLGPAIGPQVFEVGPEVCERFVSDDIAAVSCFAAGEGDRQFADIFALARLRLRRAGLPEAAIHGEALCTASDPARFFSYRREGATGRMGAFIWLNPRD